MRSKPTACRRKPLAALLLMLGAGLAPASAQEPLWSPLGPELILDGQATGARVAVTGRVNAIAVNPANPFGDIWVGSAGGGAWNGAVSPLIRWRPMTDHLDSLAVGALALDSCGSERCASVWIGSGENSIRRDTQYGRGVFKGSWNAAHEGYAWNQLGAVELAHGNVTRLLLDPTTPDGPSKRVFVALSSGVTSNATHSTVTTQPAGGYGIWRSDDGGASWQRRLASMTPATDLEMDPVNPNVLWAGLRHGGLWRSENGGATWQALTNGLPAAVLAAAEWPELAVHRGPGDAHATLYAVLGACPHPHEKAPAPAHYCSPAVYRSADSGSSWTLVRAAQSPPPAMGEPLTSYASFTHALAIHPEDPNTLWYGGLNLYRSQDGGTTWQTVGEKQLHPDHHALEIVATKDLPGGWAFLNGNDGGFFVGDGGATWSSTFQHGLAITLAQSLASGPAALLVGAQDNGVNAFLGTDVWQHVQDGNAGATLVDLDDGTTAYSNRIGVDPRRCGLPSLCKFSWTAIAGAVDVTGFLPQNVNVSWYPPFVQSVLPLSGTERPLYLAARGLYRNDTNGGVPASAPGWIPVSPPGMGSPTVFPQLGGITNPITAVGIAPSNPQRLYLGYYDGKIFTTANAGANPPTWFEVYSGLPNRPVTAIAVAPLADTVVLAAYAGLGAHSLYRSDNGGIAWYAFDAATDPSFGQRSVNALLIEPVPPHIVWAGTDHGLYQRDTLTSGPAAFARVKDLPRAAVYALKLDADGQVFAATRGRGLWARLARPILRATLEDCCGDGQRYDPRPFVSVTGLGFEPHASCTLTLVANGSSCSQASEDVGEATIATDGNGNLVSSRYGSFDDRKMLWACAEGKCAGQVEHSSCPVDQVVVRCGDREATASVKQPQETVGPAGTRLTLVPQQNGGTFEVQALLKRPGGESRSLCSATIAYGAGETSESVLERARLAVASEPGCQAAGVTAALFGSSAAGSYEDEAPAAWQLQLFAPTQTGAAVVGSITHTGTADLATSGHRDGRLGSVVMPRLTLSGTAQGGALRITVNSPLGSYFLHLDTWPGDATAALFASLFHGMTGRDTGGGLPIGGGGGPPRKSFWVVVQDEHMDLPFATEVKVHNTDPGLVVGLTSGW
jgi:hypothetical protein